MELPWTEKYRPKKLSDIVGQDKISQRLEAYVSSRSMPHILFAGPAGVGKTTAALCMVREFFGEGYRDNFLELNASDERGIEIVRGKIKEFARTRSIAGDFKIIFLDEADALTPDAQNALRRTMEKYTQTCRFILSCNYSSKIIEPIQSRCSIFRFRKVSDDAISKHLEHILNIENVKFTPDGIKAVLYIAEGDMRQALNALQSAAAIGEVDENNVFSISARAKPEDIQKIITLALNGKFLSARNMVDSLILDFGMSGEDVLLQMNKEVINITEREDIKIRIIDFIGECNFRLIEGANERIQLGALLARIMSIKGRQKGLDEFG